MNNNSWRDETINELSSLLKNNSEVLSLSIYGSLASENVEVDKWSDIDVLLVVEDDSIDKYYSSTSWLETLGEIFSVQQNSSNNSSTTKIIFKDFRKIDMIIATKSQILNSKPFWTKQKFVFSNSDQIKSILEKNAITSFAADTKNYYLDKLSNEFWFIAFTAVNKVLRKDLLIALHLTLDLYKSCLVLLMWMRDKETGTNVHRVGGLKNELIENMNIKIDDLSSKGILKLIEKCGVEFDKLAKEWETSYKEHSSTFKIYLDEAKKGHSNS